MTLNLEKQRSRLSRDVTLCLRSKLSISTEKKDDTAIIIQQVIVVIVSIEGLL